MFEHAVRVGEYLQQRLRDLEVHPLVGEVRGNGIALCPPLIISRTPIDELLGKLASALDATLDYANAQRLLAA